MRMIHPGEVLREEYLDALGISARELGKALGVSARQIARLTSEQSNVTSGMALRLSRYFGTTPEFWLNLQMTYALKKAALAAGDRITETIEPLKVTLNQQ
ncbi:HigA family addiction module antitoxin [Massilia aurea]|uniref:HigA family addiction module antitoxin n=1 Tax=Massilia aurea TaxID=373040 RepID=UPI003461B26F